MRAPDQPDLAYEIIQTDGYPKAKIFWKPNINNNEGNPGSHFYVRYRQPGESEFLKSKEIINEDYAEVGGLEPERTYEFQVVSVDGGLETPSQITLVKTSDTGLIYHLNKLKFLLIFSFFFFLFRCNIYRSRRYGYCNCGLVHWNDSRTCLPNPHLSYYLHCKAKSWWKIRRTRSRAGEWTSRLSR